MLGGTDCPTSSENKKAINKGKSIILIGSSADKNFCILSLCIKPLPVFKKGQLFNCIATDVKIVFRNIDGRQKLKD